MGDVDLDELERAASILDDEDCPAAASAVREAAEELAGLRAWRERAEKAVER